MLLTICYNNKTLQAILAQQTPRCMCTVSTYILHSWFTEICNVHRSERLSHTEPTEPYLGTQNTFMTYFNAFLLLQEPVEIDTKTNLPSIDIITD